MDTARLRTLVVAADCGSLSAAARQLRARLSTSSRHVSELEAEFGKALLIRTGRGVRPTPAGERFIERARTVLNALDSAVAELRGDASKTTTRLRISVPAEMAISVLPTCISLFHQSMPDVMLDLHSDARRVSLLEESFDAAIRLGRLTNSDLFARPLGSVGLHVCARPALARSVSSYKDLRKHRFIGVAGPPARVSGNVRGKKTVLQVEPHIRVSTFTEAAEVAAVSDFLVVLPAYTADRFLRSDALTLVSPDLKLPDVPVHMLFAEHHRATKPLAQFAELVKKRLDDIARSTAKRASAKGKT